MLIIDPILHIPELVQIKSILSVIASLSSNRWLSPVQISKISRYSAYDIRKAIDRAIADPDSSELVDRLHYRRQKIGDRYRYKLNWQLAKDLI